MGGKGWNEKELKLPVPWRIWFLASTRSRAAGIVDVIQRQQSSKNISPKDNADAKPVSGDNAAANEGASMKLLPRSDLSDRIEDLFDSVARRAFEIFDGRGRADGHDLEDWFRSSRCRRPPRRKRSKVEEEAA